MFPDAIQSYQRKPDCFQDAISLVKARCEESHMDEQGRVQAAISMTMCELATARHYSPPMECAAFTRGGHKPSSPSAHAQAQCVEFGPVSKHSILVELFWLSQRDTRWIDIDIAKDIYRNITAEKITLVRFLTEREKHSRTAQRLWEQTMKDMRGILDALRLASSGMNDASDLLTTTVSASFQSLLTDMESTLGELGRRDRTDHAEMIAKVHNMLKAVERDHSNHLTGLLPSIRSSITSELSTAIALIKDETLRNLDVAELIQRQLGSLDGSLTMMQNSLQQLVGVVGDTSKLLEASLMQAQTAQAIQGDAIAAMSHLVDTVDLLAQTTHAELEAINRTTTALTQRLKRSSSSEWMNSALISLFQLWPGMSQVDFVLSSRSLHLALRLINAFWHTIRFSVSLLMSAFVLINAKRWVPSRRCVPSETKQASLSLQTQCTLSPHAAMDMDMKPASIDSLVGPRTSRRSFHPRHSRIPDRLCKPSEHTAWP
ncbi:hypothetical protein BU15DRAFT_74064 [Melanogaster broomeanus]|nr:hypothetical protein BU15DRAFT_74064 [Melanogaster broomeanus]